MNLEKQNAGTLKTTSNGFTLVELLIAVAIIGILAAIAYPSYTQYAARGKITEAHSVLADYRVKIEQYYQDNRNYAAANGPCGAIAPSAQHQYFTLSCNAASDADGNVAQTYTATATSNAGQGLGAAGSYTFTINEKNEKATTSFPGFSVTKTCWLVKGDEC